VSPGIVEALEAIQIDHGDDEIVAGRGVPLETSQQDVCETSTIQQSG